MDQQFWRNGHLTEETFEEYAFGRLKEPEVAQVEEHYFQCERCLEELEEVEQQIKTIRVAFARQALGQPVQQAARRIPWWNWRLAFPDFSGAGGTAIAAGTLAIACLVIIVGRPSQGPEDPAPVILSSFRGGEAVMSHAPAGRPLDLTIPAASYDAAEVPSSAPFRVEVVNGVGKTTWNQAVTPSDGKLQAHVPQGLKAGRYWVRLYSPERALIGEFGLQLDE